MGMMEDWHDAVHMIYELRERLDLATSNFDDDYRSKILKHSFRCSLAPIERGKIEIHLLFLLYVITPDELPDTSQMTFSVLDLSWIASQNIQKIRKIIHPEEPDIVDVRVITKRDPEARENLRKWLKGARKQIQRDVQKLLQMDQQAFLQYSSQSIWLSLVQHAELHPINSKQETVVQDAAEVMSIANGNGLENLYCKHDGSLDDGFEMVTHPMTLAYHQTEMPWAAILRKAVQMGYTSHQAGTCGLHVHVNRNAFGETETQQDAVIARILYFVEKNWEELLKFSRRTQHQLDQWAARYGYKDQPKELLDHAKKSAHAGRYTSVNLTNKNTIEFRIFRGTLKYNTLIATLQFLDRICDVALFMSDEELKAMSWTTFVSGCTQPELVQYLKERRLYVNEPIESEAEV